MVSVQMIKGSLHATEDTTDACEDVGSRKSNRFTLDLKGGFWGPDIDICELRPGIATTEMWFASLRRCAEGAFVICSARH